MVHGVDPRVGEAVARLRAGLDRRADPDDPFRPCGVDLLPPGVRSDDLPGIPEPYAAFLRVADGATCGHAGEIHLWPADRVLGFQFSPEDEEWLPLPGGVGRWFVFGDIEQNPLLLDRETGQVWWFSDLDVVWY